MLNKANSLVISLYYSEFWSDIVPPEITFVVSIVLSGWSYTIHSWNVASIETFEHHHFFNYFFTTTLNFQQTKAMI